MTRNKLYLLLSVLLSTSYVYVIWAFNRLHSHPDVTLCTFKNITGIACPSCGSTRAVLLLTQGKIAQAGFTNPFGFIIAFIMVTLPFWLLYDVILKKDTLYKNYRSTEKFISRRWVAAILIILVAINWIWNIYKGL